MQGYIIPGIVIVAAALFVYTYNNLASMKNVVDGTWGNINTLLQKRFNLMPDLVAMVKDYLQSEPEVLENVNRARTAWINSSTVNERAGADRMMSKALRALFAASESYPELTANRGFLMLKENLSELEGEIAHARLRYNRTATVYNAAIQRFPNHLLAGPLKFNSRELFPAE